MLKGYYILDVFDRYMLFNKQANDCYLLIWGSLDFSNEVVLTND